MGEAISLSELEAGASPAPYDAARQRLIDFLVRATLVESYHSFAQHGKPYPFVTRAGLRPGAIAPGTEHPFQRGALVILVDGAMPRALRRHIRVRRANEMTAENIFRLAPDLDSFTFDPDECSSESPGFEALLDRLVDLDYGLLIQRESADTGLRLTHMHVKVERLTDNAVRQLAVTLGYIKRRLYEQGEAWVEALERKYFEYFGFSPNASGRKSAAAMAAQLLADSAERFTVFATSQEDCRLTILDESSNVFHYLLVPLMPDALSDITEETRANYVVDTLKAGSESLRCIVVLRAHFRRTASAMPATGSADTRDPDGLDTDWLELVDEAVMPISGECTGPIPIAWAEQS